MAYSVADPFPFQTAATVLAWAQAAEKDMGKGSSIVGANSGDVSVQRSKEKNAAERLELCKQSLYAKDPDTYEAFAMCGATMTGVNFAGYSSSSSSSSS